ncbi:MAG: hypothetical protein ACR2KL_01620 [Nocardioidaceae bacterium]
MPRRALIAALSVVIALVVAGVLGGCSSALSASEPNGGYISGDGRSR